VPVIADPLPGDPAALIDANGIADELRRAISATGLRLAPKVSVLVDGGGGIDLDGLFADVRLRAAPADGGPKFQIAIAGDDRSAVTLGFVTPEHAAAAVLDLLAQVAELGADARGADLLDRPAFPRPEEVPAPRTPRADPIGLHPFDHGTLALGVGLAFGHADATALAELAAVAKSHGSGWARPAPGRALLLGTFEQAGALAVRRAASGLSFVVEAADPRRRIAACPGAPLCMHGLIAARELAAEIAREVPLAAGKGIALHISGCAKGCAHPMRAPLTVIGTEKGCGLIADGTPRGRPTKHVPARDLVSALTRMREPAHA
jgi:precorrin-3B synthase